MYNTKVKKLILFLNMLDKKLQDALNPDKQENNPVDEVFTRLLYTQGQSCKWAQATIELKELNSEIYDSKSN